MFGFECRFGYGYEIWIFLQPGLRAGSEGDLALCNTVVLVEIVSMLGVLWEILLVGNFDCLVSLR